MKKLIFVVFCIMFSCTPIVVNKINRVYDCGKRTDHTTLVTTRLKLGDVNKCFLCAKKINGNYYFLKNVIIDDWELEDFVINSDNEIKYKKEYNIALQILKYMREN